MDGLTDGSESVCDEYAKKDERIKVIHQSNQGVSVARNTGLNRMAGRYVMLLDPDDAFLPETVKKWWMQSQKNQQIFRAWNHEQK